MRGAAPPIRRKRGRDLDDVELVQRRLHNHFACEFHAGCSQIKFKDCVATKATQAAVKIFDGAPEEHTTDCGQNRIAEITVQRWHRTGLDAAGESVTHDEIGSATKRFDEWAQVGEVVAVIGVAHDDEPALCVGDAGGECSAVSPNRDINHPCAFGSGDVLRTVSAPVVGDDDLAIDAQAFDRRLRLANTHRKRFGLVEARENDGEFHDSDTTRAMPSIDETKLLTDGMVIEVVRTPVNSMACAQFANHRTIDRDRFSRTSTITDCFTLSSGHRVLSNKAFRQRFIDSEYVMIPNHKMEIWVPAQ